MERPKRLREAAEAALRQYNEQLAEARTEAARIREEAKSEGTQILADLRDQAHAEVAHQSSGRLSSRQSEPL
jgi:F-type H+-transporting ATPase subunit b